MTATIISPALFDTTRKQIGGRGPIQTGEIAVACVAIGFVELKSRLPKSKDDADNINYAIGLLMTRFNSAK